MKALFTEFIYHTSSSDLKVTALNSVLIADILHLMYV